MVFALTTLTVVGRSLMVVYFAPMTTLAKENQSMVANHRLELSALLTMTAVEITCSAPQTRGVPESTRGQVIEVSIN
jgi:hypothetical protein